MLQMRFTLNVTMLDATQYIPLAQAAEEAGFHAVSVPDSIFYPEEAIGEYPYHEGREFLEDKPFVDPLIAIAAMAAATSTIQFSTFVIKLAIRDALIAAKAILSTAVMSDNRLTLGVGISPWIDDFRHCNVPWKGRGKRLDEMIEILRGVQSGDYFEYHGEHFDFPRLKMCPVPSQPIKITVGGHSAPALRRAARLGDGWVAANVTREEMRGLLSMLDGYRREYGSDRNDDFILQGMFSDIEMFDPAGYREARDMGLTDIAISLWGIYDPEQIELAERLDRIKRFAEEVLTKL
jgi:alkanesulfonate monooxygenase SsuD/methylene tetrahydromethanopterin reductase-like flavin-dependent oxidoreductase (luciferase family)